MCDRGIERGDTRQRHHGGVKIIKGTRTTEVVRQPLAGLPRVTPGYTNG